MEYTKNAWLGHAETNPGPDVTTFHWTNDVNHEKEATKP